MNMRSDYLGAADFNPLLREMVIQEKKHFPVKPLQNS